MFLACVTIILYYIILLSYDTSIPLLLIYVIFFPVPLDYSLLYDSFLLLNLKIYNEER